MAGMSLRRPNRAETRNRRWVPGAFLLTVGTALAGSMLAITLMSGLATTGTQTHEDRFVVGSSPRLVVNSSVDGDVTVRASSAESISVETRLHDKDRIDYEARQDGDTVQIESRTGGMLSFLPAWRRSANVVITAPVGTIVEVQTQGGTITMAGVHNDSTLRTTNGSIHLDDSQGNINAATTNGRITFDGAIPAGTTTRLTTTNGRLELRVAGAEGSLDARTTNGRISLEGALIGDAQTRLQTTNGGVDVRLQGTPDVTVDLATSNGPVTSKWPVTAEAMDDDTLKGTIGNGQADLTVRTSNGPITIE